jgi:hypothetical protein
MSGGKDKGLNKKRTANPIPHVIRRMTRQMNRRGLQGSDGKLLLIFEQHVENPRHLLPRHTIAFAEELLDSTDPLPDPDGRSVALKFVQSGLEVG